MGNRVAFQTAQTELSAQVLLWGEFQCHQDTDMGNAYCQSVDYGLTETDKATIGLSGLATMVRIMLMHYVNCYTFFEEPEKDWLAILKSNELPPTKPMLFD